MRCFALTSLTNIGRAVSALDERAQRVTMWFLLRYVYGVRPAYSMARAAGGAQKIDDKSYFKGCFHRTAINLCLYIYGGGGFSARSRHESKPRMRLREKIS